MLSQATAPKAPVIPVQVMTWAVGHSMADEKVQPRAPNDLADGVDLQPSACGH